MNAPAYDTTCRAVARLASLRGAEPFAQVWLVHSGDASNKSMLPIRRLSPLKSTSSRRLVTT